MPPPVNGGGIDAARGARPSTTTAVATARRTAGPLRPADARSRGQYHWPRPLSVRRHALPDDEDHRSLGAGRDSAPVAASRRDTPRCTDRICRQLLGSVDRRRRIYRFRHRDRQDERPRPWGVLFRVDRERDARRGRDPHRFEGVRAVLQAPRRCHHHPRAARVQRPADPRHLRGHPLGRRSHARSAALPRPARQPDPRSAAVDLPRRRTRPGSPAAPSARHTLSDPAGAAPAAGPPVPARPPRDGSTRGRRTRSTVPGRARWRAVRRPRRNRAARRGRAGSPAPR